MKRIIAIIFVVFFAVGCEKSTEGNPDTGISSNPNFFKGTVRFSDGGPLASALVSFIHNVDTISDITDEDGVFEVDIKKDISYDFSIHYKDSMIYNNDTFTANSLGESYIVELEGTKEDLMNSLIKDSSDTIQEENDTLDIDTLYIDTVETDTVSIVSTKSEEIHSTIFSLNSESSIYDTYIKYVVPEDADDDGEGSVLTSFSNTSSAYVGHIDDENNYRYLAKLANIDQYDTIEYSKVTIEYLSNMASSSYSDEGMIQLHMLKQEWDIDVVNPIDYSATGRWETVGVGLDDTDADSVPFFTAKLSTIKDEVQALDSDNDVVTKVRITIDITDAFKRWQADENNNGFVMTYYEEDFDALSSYFSLVTSESSEYPPKLCFTN